MAKAGLKQNRPLRCAVLLLLWAGAFWVVWQRRPFHTSIGIELTALLLLTLLTKLLGLVPLSLYSCLLLFPLLTIEALVFYQYVSYMPALALLLLLDLGLLLFAMTGRLRRYFTGMAFNGLAACFLLFGYQYLSERLAPAYYRLGWQLGLGPLLKSLLIAAAGFAFLTLYIFCLTLLGHVLSRWQDRIDSFSKRFHGLEVFVLLLAVANILFWVILDYWSFLLSSSFFVPWFLRLLPLLLFFMNAACLCLLMKAASIKERMHIAENDRSLVAAYNTELENTLDTLHEIRHDAKNLLLTMGAFVERSDDEEMKEFYQTNIVPFMQDALARNELQTRLKILEDDCLKSFLYYKIMEKTAQGIPVLVNLTCALPQEIGHGDLIRLLGILIDNAAEEAALAGGAVSLDITRDADRFHIRIANAIRPQVRARGVVPGVTDKGLGRGQGLLIVQKIIARYDNLLLNSYFTENGFVQNLILIKTN